ncbi:MAG: ATPase, T2SS/T4P/T4SS family, partial [Phycisphaerae bacterium]|nr:ATPase, T2SS/T4P/T4SS family [Phycisphaerae bacterium]
LHTNDAVGAVTRLINLGIESYLVAATVTGVLAQRLVRKLCQQCKQAYDPSPSELRVLERTVGVVEKLYKPRGCAACRNLGFSGRIGIYELFVPSEESNELIASGGTHNGIKALAHAAGMKSLRDDGLEKVRAGITTFEEVYRATA